MLSSKAALLLSFFCGLLYECKSSWSPGDSTPNIVFILADDLGYADVPWIDNDNLIQADRIKDLASNGIIFDQFYAQPSCSPSRAALLTGLYPHHTGFNV
jgi:arylsulfatase A-like enzyme